MGAHEKEARPKSNLLTHFRYFLKSQARSTYGKTVHSVTDFERFAFFVWVRGGQVGLKEEGVGGVCMGGIEHLLLLKNLITILIPNTFNRLFPWLVIRWWFFDHDWVLFVFVLFFQSPLFLFLQLCHRWHLLHSNFLYNPYFSSMRPAPLWRIRRSQLPRRYH